MKFLPVIYLIYMFVSFYLLILTLLLYFKNKYRLFYFPLITKKYSISVIVPVFNEEKTIADTINHIFSIDYDRIIEVLAINDGSIDNTLEILKSLLPKYQSRLKILNKKNSGKADSINKALKFVKGELVVIIDADSFPAKDSFSKLVGYFDDEKVGAVTATCTPKNRETFLEKMQVIEYKVIAFTRKLLEYIESIYVAPGSLSIYRKKALEEIGGFDRENITEDIEATWHLLHNGWKIRMCLGAYVRTIVPNEIKPWFKQRRRWGVGGLQVINKYKSFILRKGMFGYFVIPFFAIGLFLGLMGIIIFAYVFGRRILRNYLLTKYSIELNTAVLTMNDVFITPSVLNYFGIVLFFLFFVFTFFVLAVMKDELFEKQSFFNLMFYMIVYLLIYPVVMIVSIKHFIQGRKIWR